MTRVSRRIALGGGFAGLIGLSAPGLAGSKLYVPQGPMRLSRTLIRGLSDGNKIEVRRDWQIAFTPQGSGLAVTGHQINVEVSVPEKLEPIATIERNRATDGKFPILIDRSGLIVSAAEAELASDVDRAIEVAQQMAAKNGASTTQQQQLRAALSQVQAAGNSLLDRMPRDLFFPRNSGFADKRPISLAGGRSGMFEVSYSVTSQPLSGLLDRAERQIVTRVGNTVQVSSEHWELRAI
uniref:hypothetical protein n=1 Tax=uncultured Altererythrobacter sp. TaxID=500840 RepID=UPI0026270B1A|nr:hypothetical protein [uncultured Altererythrobacter sp.]